jgi:hypothetical protein
MNCQTHRLICSAIAICFLLSFAHSDSVVAQAVDASNHNLSTEQGITAARESLTGKKLDPADQRCLKRGRQLPIIAVGTRSLRFGCVLDGVFVRSHYVASQDAALSKEALELLGWRSRSRRLSREKLASAWVIEGLLAFHTVVFKYHDDFAGHSFKPPQGVFKDNGEVVVTLWEQLRMRGRGVLSTTYFLREYHFAQDGGFVGDVQLDRFTARKK